VDAGSGSVTVTLGVTNGTLSVTGGTATISGSGTGTVILTGTVAQINATLNASNAVTYNPTANYSGNATLSITTNDNGNTGGGVLSDSDTVAITVTPVNDAPISTNDSITILEDMNNTTAVYTLSTSDFGTYSDVEGSALASVRIDSLPTNGVLYLNATAVTAGTVVTVAQINAGDLTFNPTDNSDADSSFTFSVNDGSLWSTSSYTTVISITAVADAPIINIPVATQFVLLQNDATITTTGSNASVTSTTAGILQANLEIELGVTPGYLDNRFDPPASSSANDPGFVNIVDGKVLNSQYAMLADMSISWDYIFTNGEDLASDVNNGFNDIIALIVTHPDGTKESILIDSSEQKFPDLLSSGTYTYTATQDGTYVFDWLVLNAGDGIKDSALNISNTHFNVLGDSGDYTVPVELSSILPSLTDTDGSETLSVNISGIPTGSRFSAGTNNNDGSWTFTIAELSDLILLAPNGFTGTITLNIQAIATETSNGSTASSAISTLSITIDETSASGYSDATNRNATSEETLNGTASNDLIYGYAGNDTLNGSDGNDYLNGGAGNDRLNGDNGNDTLIGGAGNDTLNGGAGTDTFIFSALNATANGGNGLDTITDFTSDRDGTLEAGEDILDLSGIFSDSGVTIDLSNVTEYLHMNGTTLQIDRDGTGTGFAPTNLVTLTGTTITDADFANLITSGQLVL